MNINLRKKKSSILFILPIKMFFYTIIIGIFVYVSLYKFLERNYEKKMRDTALTLSNLAEWAVIPLLEDSHNHDIFIERLLKKITTDNKVKSIKIYNEAMEILYSNDKKEEKTHKNSEFIVPIIKNEKMIIKNEDFKRYIYEIAIPIKDKVTFENSSKDKKYILYLKLDFAKEHINFYRIQILGFAIVGFFLIFLLIINNSLIKYYILNPILQIKKGFYKVTNGKYDFTIEEKKEKEVNDLIKMFNKMVDYIRENSETLKKNKLQAEKLNKAKGVFLANMTHELRTPLNSIIGYSELLLEDETDENKIKQLKGIVKPGKHLLTIINNILDFSKLEAHKLTLSIKVFNIRDTFKDIEELFKITALQKKIILKFRMQESIPNHLLGDEGRIKQILINLISNSLKFTDKGHVYIIVSYKNNRLFVVVSDTGIGIKEEALLNVFDSFEQLDMNRQGTGLGLSITKTLCELMDGTITVKSVLGKGSRFVFNIKVPIGHLPNKTKKNISRSSQKINTPKTLDSKRIGKKFKILVADDIKDNQLVLGMMLKKLDVDIVFADNGKIALDLLEKEKFDLFFLDIQMPVMNGLEVLDKLRATGEINNNYVIALTAYSLNTEQSKILKAGAKGVITKPINKDEIRALVSHRIKRRMS